MSRDYWSGRPKSSPLTAQSSAESEQLKKENEKLKNSLKKKQFETESLQKELKHIEELHSRDGFTGSDRMQSMVKELRALREKTVDQAEQIETLVAELSGIRRETSDVDRKVEYSEAEVHKLKTERQQLFHRVKDLEQKMSNLHKEHERTLKQLSKAAAEKSSVSHKTRDENIDNSNSSSDVRYEDQVGGGIATATPRHFRTRLPDDTEKLTDQTANLRLYKVIGI